MKLFGQVFPIALLSLTALSAMLVCRDAFCREALRSPGIQARGQASTGVATGQQGSTAAAGDQQPVLCIFRKSKTLTNDVGPHIAVDGVLISEIFGGTYLKLTVTPGKHTVKATIGRHSASLDLDTAAGETHYLQVSPNFSRLDLAEVSRAEALPTISKSKVLHPILQAVTPNYTRAQVKAENERLAAAANQPAGFPAPPAQQAGASGATTVAAVAAPPAGSEGTAAANPLSSAGDLKAPAPASIPLARTLSDEQIRAAIQAGIGNGRLNVLKKKSLWIRGSGGIVENLNILSDSDRITLGADDASHENLKVNRQGYVVKRADKPGLAYSIEDAKSSAVLLGVVTVVVETAGVTMAKIGEWKAPGYRIVLEADGKTIEPLTDREYQAREAAMNAGTSANPMPPWNYKHYFTFTGCATFYWCVHEQLVFPAVEGAHKLKVVITSATGQRKEKEVNPKLFEEQ